jgi:hypothetical protein
MAALGEVARFDNPVGGAEHEQRGALVDVEAALARGGVKPDKRGAQPPPPPRPPSQPLVGGNWRELAPLGAQNAANWVFAHKTHLSSME